MIFHGPSFSLSEQRRNKRPGSSRLIACASPLAVRFSGWLAPGFQAGPVSGFLGIEANMRYSGLPIISGSCRRSKTAEITMRLPSTTERIPKG